MTESGLIDAGVCGAGHPVLGGGHQVWPRRDNDIAGGPRERVRITVAIGSGADFGILRYPDGRAEKLSGMQGPMGGMLHRWAARASAA